MSPEDAVREVLPRLHGALALAILFRQHPDVLIGARLGSPLVVGYGEGETYLGSDALALAPLTLRIAYLAEGGTGRGSGRVRGCQYVSLPGGADALKKKQKT